MSCCTAAAPLAEICNAIRFHLMYPAPPPPPSQSVTCSLSQRTFFQLTSQRCDTAALCHHSMRPVVVAVSTPIQARHHKRLTLLGCYRLVAFVWASSLCSLDPVSAQRPRLLPCNISFGQPLSKAPVQLLAFRCRLRTRMPSKPVRHARPKPSAQCNLLCLSGISPRTHCHCTEDHGCPPSL